MKYETIDLSARRVSVTKLVCRESITDCQGALQAAIERVASDIAQQFAKFVALHAATYDIQRQLICCRADYIFLTPHEFDALTSGRFRGRTCVVPCAEENP